MAPLRIALVVHGYPPELAGGTECMVRSLARGLVRAGHEVLVIAGSDRREPGLRVSRELDQDPGCGRSLQVLRIHRTDLHYGHWSKGFSPPVGATFEALLREHRPDVAPIAGSFDRNEVLEVRWFSHAELKRMLLGEEILDGLSLTPLLFLCAREGW